MWLLCPILKCFIEFIFIKTKEALSSPPPTEGTKRTAVVELAGNPNILEDTGKKVASSRPVWLI